MNRVLKIAVAFAAGAALMYYLDPIAGRRRRALVRDKRRAAAHDVEAYVENRAKHAADRMRGAVARTRGAMSSEPIDDERLRDRIRAKLGHLLEQPSRIDVQVHDGHVVLSGHARAEEVDELVAAVMAMRGVAEVDSRVSLETQLPDASPGAQEARH